jgi:hypothetical protein
VKTSLAFQTRHIEFGISDSSHWVWHFRLVTSSLAFQWHIFNNAGACVNMSMQVLHRSFGLRTLASFTITALLKQCLKGKQCKKGSHAGSRIWSLQAKRISTSNVQAKRLKAAEFSVQHMNSSSCSAAKVICTLSLLLYICVSLLFLHLFIPLVIFPAYCISRCKRIRTHFHGCFPPH